MNAAPSMLSTCGSKRRRTAAMDAAFPCTVLTVMPFTAGTRASAALRGGVGTASDVSFAMELGCAGVLMNTAIAGARDPLMMAEAMRDAVVAGRRAFRAGRIPRKLYATASSPLDGLID